MKFMRCTLKIIVVIILRLLQSECQQLYNNEVDKEDCSTTKYQSNEMCKHDVIIEKITSGVTKAIVECKRQFHNERWNCELMQDKKFTPLLNYGFKETAFVNAIITAGIVHEVTTECSYGNSLSKDICSCEKDTEVYNTQELYKWGCHDNINYGALVARQFFHKIQKRLDSKDEKEILNERRRRAKSLMRSHNYNTGIILVRELSAKEVKCVCKATSGNCIMKVCWKILPNFAQVGDHLKRLYEEAIKVKSRTKHKLMRKHQSTVPIKPSTLVYTTESPTFCESIPKLGVTGIGGRICNTTTGTTHCNIFCCEYGYIFENRIMRKPCNCRFIWCCKVLCDVCDVTTTTTKCNTQTT